MWDLSLFIVTAFANAGSLLNTVSIPIVIGYFIWAMINVLKLKNHNVTSIKI
jgi:hypothetical protein